MICAIPVVMNDRNSLEGRAERTAKNLEFIKTSFGANDIHVVTQLVNSLLGLVILPWETALKPQIQSSLIENMCLLVLRDQYKWPEWTVTNGSSATLFDLLEKIRHAIAHGGVRVSSDRPLEEVTIYVWNCTMQENKRGPCLTGQNTNWETEIAGPKLYEFCKNLATLCIDKKFTSQHGRINRLTSTATA